MKDSMLQKLYEGRGKVAWITIGDTDPVLAGIHLIDEKFQTLTLLNGKGSRALKALQEKGNGTGEQEQEIMNNPENFSVYPFHEIKKVELLG